MHQKKNRPIHDKYKINQQKNQKDIKLNENILKTNISEINESQDEKSQYNNQEKLKKKKYNDRENRFMQKKTKRKDTDSETDSKYVKHFKREKRNKITFIKTYDSDSDSESEEKLLNTRIGLKESIPQEKVLKTINVLSPNQKINESDLLNKFNDNNTVDKIMRNKNKINFKENLLHIEYDQENLKNEENVNKQIKKKFEQQDEKYEQQKKKVQKKKKKKII